MFEVERAQLVGLQRLFWQTDKSISKNPWGYVKNQDYKMDGSIGNDLVDIVSKNVLLLRNIGPFQTDISLDWSKRSADTRPPVACSPVLAD